MPKKKSQKIFFFLSKKIYFYSKNKCPLYCLFLKMDIFGVFSSNTDYLATSLPTVNRILLNFDKDVIYNEQVKAGGTNG